MNQAERANLRQRLEHRGPSLRDDPRIRARVDRDQCALTLALFLEYARRQRLTPAEAHSLLVRAGGADERLLGLLGLEHRPAPRPGRHAETHAGHTARPPAPRPPGR